VVGSPDRRNPEGVEARVQEMLRRLFQNFDVRYQKTRNPVFVWEAIHLALERRAPLPDWVIAYLGRVSAQIRTLSRTGVPRKNEVPRAVYRALEFSNRTGQNPFTAISDAWHAASIALDVWYEMRDGTKLDFALDAAAKTHTMHCTRDPRCPTISRTTVARAWRRFQVSIVPPPRNPHSRRGSTRH
jgi:hypothetical protein